jgi:hypothetical protein
LFPTVGLFYFSEDINHKCFKKRVLREIFGRKKYEVSEKFRLLHDEELHVTIVKSRLARHIARMEETRNACH